jgi:hypothetical protein
MLHCKISSAAGAICCVVCRSMDTQHHDKKPYLQLYSHVNLSCIFHLWSSKFILQVNSTRRVRNIKYTKYKILTDIMLICILIFFVCIDYIYLYFYEGVCVWPKEDTDAFEHRRICCMFISF